MSNTVVFTRDPTITFPPAEIARLADRHKIDETLLEAIVAEAATFYGIAQWSKARGYDGSDTLDQIEESASALLNLLANEVNRHRLLVTLAGVEDGHAANDFVTIGGKLDELVPFLEDIRSAAREAHRTRAPWRPENKADLAAAYHFLVKFWPTVGGGHKFTNGWHKVKAEDKDQQPQPPIPTSRAACFLYDVMKLIDPTRERLAKELRDLMAGTVKSRRGQRKN